MPVSETQITRSYNQEQIQQILQIAIARQTDDTEFTREQLLEIASELEISPECLQVAEQQWLAKQGEIQKRQDFNRYRRTKLQQQAGKYTVINSFLMLLNIVNAGQLSWSLYIALFWGLGLGLNALNTFQSGGEDYEKAFQRWYRQYQLKQSLTTVWDKVLKAWQT